MPSRSAERASRAALRPGLVMVGLLLIGANLRAGITSVGPVLDNIQAQLHISAATASALISVPLVAFAVVSPLAPLLGRRLGLEQTLALALVVLTAGIVVRSLPGPGLIWVGTVLLGVAVAVINVELPALVKRDFPARIGQMTGAYSAVQSTFAALAAGLAVPIAGMAAAGWRLSLGVWAGLAVVALAVFAPQLRRHTRELADEYADGWDEPVEPGDHSTRRSPWRTALGWQVSLFMGLQSIGYYVVITWMPTIEKDGGIGATAAGVHQFLLNGFAIGGSLICSALIPRLRDQRGLALATVAGFTGGLVGHLLDPGGALVWDCLLGLSGGASIVLALSFFGLRTRHHPEAASLSGMAQSIGYVLAAAGPIVFSSIHDVTGSWTPSLLMMLGVQALLAVTAVLAGRARYLS